MDFLSSETVQSPSNTFSSGSKTESIKSGASENRQREEDYTKDNVASPIDLEVTIQTDRITKISDEAIYKTKLAVCLPQLVHQGILRKILSHPHYEDVTLIFEQYYNEFSLSGFSNTPSLDDLKMGNRLNPELAHVICILNSYSALRPVVQEMTDKMKESYKSHVTMPPQPELEFLLLLEQFRELLLVQLERTAAKEIEMIAKTKKIIDSNISLVQKIKEYTTRLEYESKEFEETMAKKAITISQLEHELTVLNREADVKRKSKILHSERQMVLASRSHEVKNEILIEEEWQTREHYDSSLKTHLKKEKELRQRQFKVETQLLTWVQKYDQDMSVKQEELNDFVGLYDTEEKLVNDLEVKLENLDKEYVPLMEEREKEYNQEMEEKMKAFMHEHAARIIQYAWRTVQKNRSEKKRLKKLVLKMEEEKERAAMIQRRKAEAEKKMQKKLERQEKKDARKQKKKGQGTEETVTANEAPSSSMTQKNTKV